MPRWAQSVALTVLGFLLIVAAVGLTMWFAVSSPPHGLGIDKAYWLVPILGAAGGAVGGLLRSQEKEEQDDRYFFRLCSLEPPPALIDLGILGDTVVGIGGATAAVFLFGGTLKFEPGKPETFVLLVSVSFIAGVFGRKLVETAGERLLNQAREAAKEAARKESILPAAMAAVVSASQLYSAGQYAEAVKVLDDVIKNSPTYIPAYIEKGRALKKMGQIKEALAAVNQALAMKPADAGFGNLTPTLLYNRACYKALAASPLPDVLADLKQAISGDPTLKADAPKDEDFKSIWDKKEFLDLVSPATPNQS